MPRCRRPTVRRLTRGLACDSAPARYDEAVAQPRLCFADCSDPANAVDVSGFENEPVGTALDDAQHGAPEAAGGGEERRHRPDKEREERREHDSERLIELHAAADPLPRLDEAGRT